MTDHNTSGGMSAAAFHRRGGVSAWRVTATGAQAVFTVPSAPSATEVPSLAPAAALVSAIVAAGEQHHVAPDVDLRPTAVVVLVPYQAHQLPAGTAAFAAAVAAAAAAAVLDLDPDPSLIQSVDLAVAQGPSLDTRPFWSAALGYDPTGDVDAVDPLRRGPQLSFQPIRGNRPGRGRTHVDVSVPADQAPARVRAALAAGGRLVDDSYAPAWWTLASADNHGVDIAAWTDTHE